MTFSFLMSLREYVSELNFFGDLQASWIWMVKSLSRFEKFAAIISINKLSASLPLSSPSGTLIIHKLLLLIVFHRAHMFFSLFFSFSNQFQRSCLLLHRFFSFHLIQPTNALYYVFHFFHCILLLSDFHFLFMISISFFEFLILFMYWFPNLIE